MVNLVFLRIRNPSLGCSPCTVFQDFSNRKNRGAPEAYEKLYIFGISEKNKNFGCEIFLARFQVYFSSRKLDTGSDRKSFHSIPRQK